MNQLQGKIAVITGGTSCIGLAAAEVFLREGARAAKMKVAAMSASSEENSRGRPSGFFDILHDGFSFLTKQYDILLTCGFQPRTIRTIRFKNPHRRGWPC